MYCTFYAKLVDIGLFCFQLYHMKYECEWMKNCCWGIFSEKNKKFLCVCTYKSTYLRAIFRFSTNSNPVSFIESAVFISSTFNYFLQIIRIVEDVLLNYKNMHTFLEDKSLWATKCFYCCVRSYWKLYIQ